MPRPYNGESGQVSILVLVLITVFLAATIVIGMFAEVLVAQQRLNSKAETIALAGAIELEFNRDQACAAAQDFSTTNFGITAECVSQVASIEILLTESNPNRFLSVYIPRIQASSRAGIASDD